jgi:hypothetical protein
MRVPWLRRRKTCLLVGLLLLPALAARLLVPPGFMPGTGADGAPTMQMCHGAGPPTPESIIVQRALHRAQSARAPPTDSYPA